MSKIAKTTFRLLDILVIFVMTFGQPMSAFAAVWTDQQDYSPGSVVTISGDNSTNVLALRTSDGATLWHANIGRMQSAPITYQLDGKQYVVLGGGSSLYAFALP